VGVLSGTEIRGQGSGIRDQRSETRGQRSGVRGQDQRSETRGQRSEIRGQRSEIRGQRSGVRGQGSGNRDQGSGIRDQGSGIRDQGSGIRDQRPGVRDQGSGVRIRDQRPGVRDQGSGVRIRDQGSEIGEGSVRRSFPLCAGGGLFSAAILRSHPSPQTTANPSTRSPQRSSLRVTGDGAPGGSTIALPPGERGRRWPRMESAAADAILEGDPNRRGPPRRGGTISDRTFIAVYPIALRHSTTRQPADWD
jgi:hypothetical protein